MSKFTLEGSNTLNIGTASLDSDGRELTFTSQTGRKVSLEEIIMLMDFLDESSISEEYKEYKTFRKLQE